jgi:hypothetical protein
MGAENLAAPRAPYAPTRYHRSGRAPIVWYAKTVTQNPDREHPGVLRRLWHGWKRVGKKIGDFQARLLLTIFYFLLVSPFAMIVRAASDPLALKPTTTAGWRGRPPAASLTVEIARRQF